MNKKVARAIGAARLAYLGTNPLTGRPSVADRARFIEHAILLNRGERAIVRQYLWEQFICKGLDNVDLRLAVAGNDLDSALSREMQRRASMF